MKNQFNTIPEILEDIKMGKIVIVLDDADRENEGDFLMASDFVSSEAINFMAHHGRGLICTPIDHSIAEKLGLSLMVSENEGGEHTAFTVSIDAKNNIATGISVKDRAHTISLMMNKNSSTNDFQKPGHVFPIIAKKGGVLERRGHTEAAVDLAKLCGLNPSGVLCEILKADGGMARGDELFEIAAKFNLKIGTIADLVDFLKKK